MRGNRNITFRLFRLSRYILGVGRVYQQTFIDTYSKVAHCKLCVSKTSITAADLLNDRVLPFYESHDLSILRILIDGGTEFCGQVEQHDYQLYLAINDIDHTKTKAMSPQTNGICECFQKTILQKFYQITSRKKLCSDLETLQSRKSVLWTNTNRNFIGWKTIWAEKNLTQI